MKMSRFQTFSYINAMMLHPEVPKMGEYNIGMVRRVEKMGRVTGMESIERVKGVEEAIRKIRLTR